MNRRSLRANKMTPGVPEALHCMRLSCCLAECRSHNALWRWQRHHVFEIFDIFDVCAEAQ